MNLANKITLARIILIPVFIITLLQGLTPLPAVIFTFTIVTDALDGFVARYKKQKTKLGSFLDPLADKLLMLSSYVTLAYLHKLPLWVFVVILSRDIIIVLGWVIIYFMKGTTDIEPRYLSKATTVFQMFAVWLIILGVPANITNPLLLITVGFTIASGLDYIVVGSKKL